MSAAPAPPHQAEGDADQVAEDGHGLAVLRHCYLENSEVPFDLSGW
jgi:hypothetical protein